MKNTYKLIALTAVMLLGAVFGGCSRSGKLEIAFWGGWTGPDRDAMMRIVNDFNAKNPDINVTLTPYQWDALFNKLLTSSRAGNPPDLIAMHQTDIPQYANMGVIEPMDKSLADTGLKQEDFTDGVWVEYKYKDSMYAMPLDVHPFGMYYNKDMFVKAGLDPENPPTDRDGLLAAAQKLTIRDASGKVTQYGIGIPSTHQHAYRYWYSLLHQNGGAFFGPDGKTPAFNSPRGEEAYQFLNDLVYKYKVAPEQETNTADDFKALHVAIIFEGPWWIPGMSEVKGLNFGIAPFPQIFARRAVWANGHGLCLPKQANLDPAKRAATLKLLKFISDNSLEWAKGGQIPVRKSVLENPEFKKLTLLKPFMDSVPYAVFLPKLERGSEIFASNSSTPMMAAMQEVMLNSKSPKDALDAAAAKVSEILGR